MKILTLVIFSVVESWGSLHDVPLLSPLVFSRRIRLLSLSLSGFPVGLPLRERKRVIMSIVDSSPDALFWFDERKQLLVPRVRLISLSNISIISIQERSYLYVDLFQDVLIPKLISFARKCQQRHSAMIIQEEMKQHMLSLLSKQYIYGLHNVRKMLWPPNSPDLNMIEAVWR